MSSTKKFNLEKSLADLEELVEELESGDLPLEKALKKFEEGIKLTRGCQAALKDAEQKVEVLLSSGLPARRSYSAIRACSATTVDSTPALTDGSGEILNSGE